MKQRRTSDIRPYRASGRERLEQLVVFLESLPPGRLTFLHWYDKGRGCAVGLAASLEPWFMAQGLKMEGQESLKDCRPTYEGMSDWAAVAAFFEISIDQAKALFHRQGYDGELRPTPKRVAGKVRRYLSQGSSVRAAADALAS